MIHARDDYNRIQDPSAEKPSTLEALAFACSVILSGEEWTPTCEQVIGSAIEREMEKQRVSPNSSPIAPDEPVFLFRAKDCHFASVLEHYLELVLADKIMADSIKRHLLRAEEWQSNNGTQLPNMPINLSDFDN